MAVVYRARERDSGRLVAVKVIARSHATDPESVRRFAREARTVMSLQHPNIARTLGIEELAGGAVAIVTAFVPGETLRDALRDAGPLPFDRVTQLLRDVASALAHAHGERIVHRDVKPENILVHAGSGRALLVDFGIARPLDGDTLYTEAGSSLGTPTYMSPEQVAGLDVDQRTDVYALGLLGWEMVAGRRPWEGETLYTVLHKQQHEKLPSLSDLRPDIPAFLAIAINGALLKNPDERWYDAGEFLARLSPTPVPLPPPPVYDEVDDGHEPGPTGRIEVPIERRRAPELDRRELPDESVAAALPLAGERADAREVPDADTPLPVAAASGDGDSPAASTHHPEYWDTAPSPPRRRRRWGVVGAVAAAALLLAAAAALTLQRNGNEVVASAAPDSTLESLLDRATAMTDSAYGTLAPPADSADSLRENDGLRAADRPSDSPAPVPPDEPSPASTPPLARTSSRPRPSEGSLPDSRCRSPASADQRACLLAFVERDDAPLTEMYVRLIRELRTEAGGELEPPRVRALRAEQRAWLVERDRICRERLRGREGALWAVDRAPCFAELSSQRASTLRERLIDG